MTGLKMTARAFNVARKAHKGQKDNGGAPYILHLIRVAMACKGAARKSAALLHHAVEDGRIAEKDLRGHGFPEEVVRAVATMAKGDKESLEEYIRRLSLDPVAMDVKIEDTKHDLKKSLYYAKNHTSMAEQAKMERKAIKCRKKLARLLQSKDALATG